MNPLRYGIFNHCTGNFNHNAMNQLWYVFFAMRGILIAMR